METVTSNIQYILDSLVVPPSSATLVNSCGIPFIGFQSASVSFIGFLQLLGVVSLALLLLIFRSFLSYLRPVRVEPRTSLRSSVRLCQSSVLLYLLNSPVYLLIPTLATSPLRFPILLCILLFSVSTCVPLSLSGVSF